MYLLESSPSLVTSNTGDNVVLSPNVLDVWYSLREWYQAYPMRANYYNGSGVLSSFLLTTIFALTGIAWNAWRIGNKILQHYGSLLLLMFIFYMVPWCMSAILKAIHTLEVQSGHMRMLRRLKFNKMDKDEAIINKIDTLIELIEENDKPPKIFDTIPLNRVTFNLVGTSPPVPAHLVLVLTCPSLQAHSFHLQLLPWATL